MRDHFSIVVDPLGLKNLVEAAGTGSVREVVPADRCLDFRTAGNFEEHHIATLRNQRKKQQLIIWVTVLLMGGMGG